jgi:predicted TIM-barrel fold metal-dependent hydrolase
VSAHRTPEEVRKHLKHPVIDADGHWVEYTPVFGERIRKAVGNLGADGFLEAQRRIPNSLKLTPAERAQRGVGMEGFWGRQSTNTLDRATAMMPRLLYDRLDELGLDYCVIYPTAGLSLPRIADDAVRRAVIRGFNIVTLDFFKGLEDRLTPAAVIPVHTPDEAIEELEFVVKQLGAKVCMFGSGVRRMHDKATGVDPDVARLSQAFDQLGLDSQHDYDPLWRKCRELKIAPTFHTGGRSYGERNSPTNFTSTISATSPPPSTPWRRLCSWAV